MRIGQGAVPSVDVTDRTARDVGFVRDFWFNRIRAGAAFSGGDGFGASVGNFSVVQLFNPTASTIRVVVYRFALDISAAGNFTARLDNTARITLGNVGQNLLNGGAAPQAQIRKEQPAASPGNLLFQNQIAANTAFWFDVFWYMELPATAGITIAPATANVAINVSFMWVEL